MMLPKRWKVIRASALEITAPTIVSVLASGVNLDKASVGSAVLVTLIKIGVLQAM
jgi:hypothetical protein